MTTAVNIESIEARINELGQTRTDCLREATIVMERAKQQKDALIAQANTAHGGIKELEIILESLKADEVAVDDGGQPEEPAHNDGDEQHTG
jgi:hypothetical protein